MWRLVTGFSKTMAEKHLVKTIKKGLKESVARYVYAMDIFTINKLRDEAAEGRAAASALQPRVDDPRACR